MGIKVGKYLKNIGLKTSMDACYMDFCSSFVESDEMKKKNKEKLKKYIEDNTPGRNILYQNY